MIKTTTRLAFNKMLMAFNKTLMALILMSNLAWAGIEVYEFDNPAQEAQYQALIADFRCPTCQNQNLAGSDAPIAKDLKQKTYEMVKEGRSDSEIRAYMSERYGDFISYKPPVRPSTWILWFFPPVVLVVVLIGWVIKNRKKSQKTAPTPQTTDTQKMSHTSESKPQSQPLSADEEKALADLLANYSKNRPTTNGENK